MVKKGDILAELQNTDLDVKITELEGQLSQAIEDLSSVSQRLFEAHRNRRNEQQKQGGADEESRLASEESQLKEKRISLEAQLQILRNKKERLNIRSPIDGQVTTWDTVNTLEGRTVQPGQVLMSVSDPSGPWELEVAMPEDNMGYIARAQKELGKKDLEVSYILHNTPSDRHQGTITDVHLSAEVRGDEGNTVLIHVSIDKNDIGELNQGAGVYANVLCGTRCVGFVWFHDVIEFIQSRILFRL